MHCEAASSLRGRHLGLEWAHQVGLVGAFAAPEGSQGEASGAEDLRRQGGRFAEYHQQY